MRWNHAKLVYAAAAHRDLARGGLAVFDGGWRPRIGLVWPGKKGMWVRVSRENFHLLLSDVRPLPDSANSSATALQTVAIDSRLAESTGLCCCGPCCGCTFHVNVVRQENHHVHFGQFASSTAIPAWGGACPASIVDDFIWFSG